MDNNELTDIELDALVILIRNMSAKEIQDRLERNKFSAKVRPYVEEFLPHKIEEERNAPITMYHRRKAPESKIFKAYELATLKKGWVDSPDKFKKGIKDKIIFITKLLIFLLWHDKKPRGVTKYIAITTVSLIGALWGFPLANLSRTGVMPPEIQRTLRIIGTCLLLSISLLSFAILAFVRYRKYKDTTKLSYEELSNFVNHMKNT